MEEVKRMRYYDGLSLKAEDYTTDQNYNIQMRRLMNWSLNKVSGILKGLEVQPIENTKKYRITKGIALSNTREEDDWFGTEIVLPSDKEIDLSDKSPRDYYVTITYDEVKADIDNSKGPQEIHWIERPKISIVSLGGAIPPGKIILAKVTVPPEGEWKSKSDYVDKNDRKEIGCALRSINHNVSLGTSKKPEKLEVTGDIKATGIIEATGGFKGDGSQLTGVKQWNETPDGISYGSDVSIGGTVKAKSFEGDGSKLTFGNDVSIGGAVKAKSFEGDGSKLTGVKQWTDAGGGISYNKGKVGIGTGPLADLDVNGYLHLAGNPNPDVSAQGAYIGWNALTGGTGEMDFINNQGLGSGGFAFMNTLPGGVSRNTLMYISGEGDVSIGGAVKANSFEGDGSKLTFGSDVSIGGVVKANSFEGDGSKLTGVKQWNYDAGGISYNGNIKVTDKVSILGVFQSDSHDFPPVGPFHVDSSIVAGIESDNKSNALYFHIDGNWKPRPHPRFPERIVTSRSIIVGEGWTFYGCQKNFLINHPLYPETHKLVHSTLEGPEVAVFYRGEAQLSKGEATVILPEYFEALTREENRTVLLTSKFENDNKISMLAASEVKDGKFTVKMIDGKNPSQKFYWEVKAVRADVESLEVEPAKIPD